MVESGGGRKIKLVLAYDGTDFHGWQEQPGQRTVQGALQEALARITGARPCTRAAGRTDARVHAERQVVTFRTDSTIPCEGLARGLTALLRPDVVVRSAEEVEDSFDARRSATGKHYRYRVLATPEPSPILRRETWWVPPPLDVDAMQVGAAALLGTHDFAAFRSARCAQTTTVRTVSRLDVVQEGDEVRFEVEGKGFLMNMVRILVGTLVEVGQGKTPAASIADVLERRERARAGRTAPPEGLTLVGVFYAEPRPGST